MLSEQGERRDKRKLEVGMGRNAYIEQAGTRPLNDGSRPEDVGKMLTGELKFKTHDVLVIDVYLRDGPNKRGRYNPIGTGDLSCTYLPKAIGGTYLAGSCPATTRYLVCA